MQIITKDAHGVTLRFEKGELDAIAEPLVQNAEVFARHTLDLAYLLAEQSYRMRDTFHQPPHAFGD